MSSAKLTPEQEKFLQELEEDFKDRYTEKDEGYKATLDRPLPLPPTEANWNQYRSFDNRRDYHRDNRDYHRNNRDYYRDNRYRDRNYEYGHSSSRHDGYYDQRDYKRPRYS